MWHFTETNKLLRFGDGRKVVAGKTLKVEGPVEWCNRGLHACKNILDAVNYAPGPYVWFVELGEDTIHDTDKSVSTSRKAVWGYDATEVLREFSHRVALDSVRKYWNSKKFGEFPEVTLKYLQTGDESLRFAAESAAWSAARSAARSAAWSAAESAAESAARSAAWSAARFAAWSAAESAAESAARSAAWSAARSAAWSAAESAAESEYNTWSTARSAARSEYNTWLEEMILAGRPKKIRKTVKK